MATITGVERPVGTDTKRLRRTTGALCGALIVLLGLWGALVPFVGPYFHYAFGSFDTWHYSAERLWLSILPGAVAVIGGLLLLFSSTRMSGLIGGWLAVAAGAWFAIGPSISLLWHRAGNPIGAPMGGHIRQALELFGYFQGLGVVIVALAAFATGRYYSRPSLAEQLSAPAERPGVAAEEPVGAVGEEPVGAVGQEPVDEERVGSVGEEPAAARRPAGGDQTAPEGEPAVRETTTARGEQALVSPDASTPGATGVTYRRRRGLFRFRRR